MKRFYFVLVLNCLVHAVLFPLLAEDLWDVVEEAQNTIIWNYPSEDSIARKLALKELSVSL